MEDSEIIMMQLPLRFEAVGWWVGEDGEEEEGGGMVVESSRLDWNKDSAGRELSCSGGRRRLSGLCHLAQSHPG